MILSTFFCFFLLGTNYCSLILDSVCNLRYKKFFTCIAISKHGFKFPGLSKRIANVFAGKNVYNVQGGIKGHGAFSKDYKTEVAKGATLNQNIS